MMKRRSFLKLSAGVGVMALGGFGAAGAIAGNSYYRGAVSDHFDGKRFFNPEGELPGGTFDLIQWKLGSDKSAWPDSYPSQYGQVEPAERITGNQMRVTFIGHASFLIQVAQMNILVDPVWSERTSPFSFMGPKRVNAPGVKFDDLPPIDLVLITHNHYDHLDVETLKALQARHNPLFITPLGNDAIIRRHVSDANIMIGDWGDVIEVAPKFKVHFEPCHHWSARGIADRRMALWAAFVLETPAGKIYHIGDTGFHKGINYKKAAEKHGGFRLANFPIGAYEPRWFMKGQHQDPYEAVEGMLLSRSKYVCGHHWGTVQLTDEAIEAPVDALKLALAAEKIDERRFRAMRPGEVFDVPA